MLHAQVHIHAACTGTYTSCYKCMFHGTCDTQVPTLVCTYVRLFLWVVRPHWW